MRVAAAAGVSEMTGQCSSGGRRLPPSERPLWWASEWAARGCGPDWAGSGSRPTLRTRTAAEEKLYKKICLCACVRVLVHIYIIDT